MVRVNNALLKEGDKGTFVVLELQGELEVVVSKETGKPYFTARKCTIPCTLELQEAQGFIGKELPGAIQKIACEPYDYTVEETGEVIKLSHRWQYVPEKRGIAIAPVVEMSVGRLTA